jgi:hypothetical protein
MNALSLQFEEWGSGNFAVSFSGNGLLPVPLSTGVGAAGQIFEVYGVNIASYEGETGQLEFTALYNNGINFGNIELDDIAFSTQAVPEPKTVELVFTAAMMLGLQKWGRHVKRFFS